MLPSFLVPFFHERDFAPITSPILHRRSVIGIRRLQITYYLKHEEGEKEKLLTNWSSSAGSSWRAAGSSCWSCRSRTWRCRRAPAIKWNAQTQHSGKRAKQRISTERKKKPRFRGSLEVRSLNYTVLDTDRATPFKMRLGSHIARKLTGKHHFLET